MELSVEELKELIRKIGFEISVSAAEIALMVDAISRLQNEKTIDTTYTNNAQSMLGYLYHAEFWTATKVA